MDRPSARQILRYRFDTFMARGGSSIFLSLLIIFLSLLSLIAALRFAIYFAYPDGASPDTPPGFASQLYVVFLEMTDPGNMNQDIRSHPIFKVPGIIAGLAGVIILSMLIAFITTALDQKLHQLKKGHSKVIEKGHSLILGWNDRTVEIIKELILANESERNPCVVILSDKDKEWMDDFLHVRIPDSGNTRIVTRSGAVSSLDNLDIVSLRTSKSTIVLATCSDSSPDREKAVSDTKVIKTILAAMAKRRPEQKLNIVAELFFNSSRRVAAEISTTEVTTIDAIDILAKILVQTSRSVGLSMVYAEALSFDGCELYFHNAKWADRTFGQVQFHFPDGVPLGIREVDGNITINPPADRVMRRDDEVLLLADDDSTIHFRKKPVAVGRDLELAGGRLERRIENELIIGWNLMVPVILREYADYVLDGTSIDIMIAEPDEEISQAILQLQEELSNLRITLIRANPLKSKSLRDVHPFRYDNIIILSQGGADAETTDSGTIVILLLLRHIFEEAEKAGQEITSRLITEVMDSDNQELVARAGVNDFIISNRFVSMILAQISEEPAIKHVYDSLFSEDGSEIYLKPASLYLEGFPVEVTFADMMALAQKRNEVCVGMKVKSLERDSAANFGVKLIPNKKTRYALNADDSLIVVAEDET